MDNLSLPLYMSIWLVKSIITQRVWLLAPSDLSTCRPRISVPNRYSIGKRINPNLFFTCIYVFPITEAKQIVFLNIKKNDFNSNEWKLSLRKNRILCKYFFSVKLLSRNFQITSNVNLNENTEEHQLSKAHNLNFYPLFC